MAKNTIILAAVAVFFSGNVPVEVPAGTEVRFPQADSTDAVAEALAQNQRLYADNRAQLAHEVTRDHVFAAGEAPRPARFKVSYGVGGSRVEAGPFEVEAAPEQSAGGFKVGDVVFEAAAPADGAVKMTVIAIEGDQVKCNWFEGAELREAVFAADMLVIAEPAS